MSEYNGEFIEFPKEWEVKRLSEIAELQRGLSYSGSEKSKDEIPDGYLFLTLNSIKEGGGLKEDGWTWIKSDRLKERHFVREGDIVIANTDIGMQRGHILGAPAIVHFPEWYKKDKAVFSHHISKLFLKVSNLDVNFLFYYLSFVQPLARKYHIGTGVWGLNVDSWAKDLLVPIPPPEEQKKIAEILNTVDSIIIDTTNLIEKLKLLKEKTLNLLITGKIWHKEFKDTEIGKIPKNWEIVKLEEIAVDIYRYPTYYNIKYVGMNEGVPEVRAELIKENGELEDDLSKYRFISKETSKRFYRTILHEGDFVLSVRGTLGKVAIVPKFLEGANITANLMKISLNRLKCYPPFFKQFFLSDFFKKNLDNISSQTTIKTIQASKLKLIKIPLPPLEEQKKIAEILSTIDNKIETETKYLEYMKKLKEKLLAALMTGKIRVNSISIGDIK